MNTKEILQGIKTWTIDKLNTKADKSATVSNVTYDINNKKLKKTINGTTSDVVSTAQIILDGGVSQMINTAKSEIVGDAASDYNTLGKLEDKILEEASRAQEAESELDSGKADKASTLAGYGIIDAYTKSETYTKTEVNGLVDTPHQEYVTVDAYANLPATGSKDTIYRVSNYNGSTSQVDASVYSEYAWNGSQYVFLCAKSQIGEVFDISVYNNNAKYADFAAALNGGANIPQSLQKGGMSVKFVQSSDNKYVQYRLMADEFSTTPSDWQSLNDDDEPTAGSDNLVKSGGIFKNAIKAKGLADETCNYTLDVVINNQDIMQYNNLMAVTDYIPVSQNVDITCYYGTEAYVNNGLILLYDAEKNVLDWFTLSAVGYRTINTSNATYIRFSFAKSYKENACVMANSVKVWKPENTIESLSISDIKDAILSGALNYRNIVYDSSMNIISADITYPNGVFGTIGNVIVLNGNIQSVDYTYNNSLTYRYSINYDDAGNVFSTQLVKL